MQVWSKGGQGALERNRKGYPPLRSGLDAHSGSATGTQWPGLISKLGSWRDIRVGWDQERAAVGLLITWVPGLAGLLQAAS